MALTRAHSHITEVSLGATTTRITLCRIFFIIGKMCVKLKGGAKRARCKKSAVFNANVQMNFKSIACGKGVTLEMSDALAATINHSDDCRCGEEEN